MIDNTLPSLSREFLRRSLAQERPKQASVTIKNGDFRLRTAVIAKIDLYRRWGDKDRRAPWWSARPAFATLQATEGPLPAPPMDGENAPYLSRTLKV
jgi:hypothetical protein